MFAMPTPQERLVTTYFHRMRSASKKPLSPGAQQIYEAMKARIEK